MPRICAIAIAALILGGCSITASDRSSSHPQGGPPGQVKKETGANPASSKGSSVTVKTK